MAVPLEVGYNKLVLSYTIPGLKYGMMISGFTLVVLVFWKTVRQHKRKKRGKKYDENYSYRRRRIYRRQLRALYVRQTSGG